MRKAALSLFTAAAITMTAGSNALAEISWQTNLRSAHAQAQTEGKLLLLHFYSDNCSWCERLEAGSFKAPQVGEAVHRDFVPVKIHANTNAKLTEMFKVTKFPTDVIVTTKGTTLSHTVSPQKPERYVAMLTTAASAEPAQNASPGPATAPTQKVAAIPASTKSVPSYAAGDMPNAPSAGFAPSPVAAVPAPRTEPAAEAGGLALPGAALMTGPLPTGTGHFAGARSEGMSLQMPLAGGAIDAPAVAPSIEVLAPELTTTELATPSLTASAPEPVQPQPASSQLAGEEELAKVPELAMQGFCAVTVINEDRWSEGSAQYGVIHLGKLYLFVSEQAMQTFLADPAPYTPVLNEIDVVRFFEEEKIVPGKREWGVKDPIHNRMFFFADEAARDHFEKQYERYTDAAIQVMDKAVREANPGT